MTDDAIGQLRRENFERLERRLARVAIGPDQYSSASLMAPKIKMIVGDWVTDTFGNRCREITASD
jgi:hypothetical protein